MSRDTLSPKRIRTIVVSAILFAFSLTFYASIQSLSAQGRQLSLADILIALRSKKAEIDEKNRILTDAVKERGITFTLTPEIEKELDNTGARAELITAIRAKAVPVQVAEIKKAEPPKVETPAPKPVAPVEDFAFFRQRAAASVQSGSYESAMSDLTKALGFKPDDISTLMDRASVNIKVGKTELALADLEKVATLDPKNALAQSGRAQLLEKSGKIEAAIAAYDKAFELDKSDQNSKAAADRLRLGPAEAAKRSQPVPEIKPPAAVVSVGPLTPYAVKLATPAYTEMDRRLNLFGRVTVQVQLDENGTVISAQSTEGAKSLRSSAEEAVRRSKFRPVKVGETPVKATGFIIFNFVNQ